MYIMSIMFCYWNQNDPFCLLKWMFCILVFYIANIISLMLNIISSAILSKLNFNGVIWDSVKYILVFNIANMISLMLNIISSVILSQSNFYEWFEIVWRGIYLNCLNCSLLERIKNIVWGLIINLTIPMGKLFTDCKGDYDLLRGVKTT